MCLEEWDTPGTLAKIPTGEMYFLLNTAINKNNNPSSSLNTTMQVDYVRAWIRN